MNSTELLIETFCQQHVLPKTYRSIAKQWFIPLALAIAQQSLNASRAETTAPPLFIGINGCQGSGKSTLAALLKQLFENNHQLSTLIISIDDFYLTRQERKTLAHNKHSLFMARGVPGAHDTQRLIRCFEQLKHHQYPIDIPRFDKTLDDRHPKSAWDTVKSPVDIVILEGWCIGSLAQDNESLVNPINKLEADEDSGAVWRTTSNQLLGREYQEIFQQLDQMIMLKAPNFDCVYQWRKTQEDKLRQMNDDNMISNNIMSDQQLMRFIQHYQRITEHTLETLPKTADIIFHLNDNHEITHQQNNP